MIIGKKTRIFVMAIVAYVHGKSHNEFDGEYIEKTTDGFIEFWNNRKIEIKRKTQNGNAGFWVDTSEINT